MGSERSYCGKERLFSISVNQINSQDISQPNVIVENTCLKCQAVGLNLEACIVGGW